MNEKQIKELYKTHAKESAPNFDKLWEKIEQGLEEKPQDRITSTENPEYRRKRIATNKQLGMAAACFALLLIIPVAVSQMSNKSMSNEMSLSMADEAPSTNAMQEAKETEATENAPSLNGYDDNDYHYTNGVLYENLPLNQAGAELNLPHGTPDGDEYFVEDNVLAETQVFMHVIVENSFMDSTGEQVVYELRRVEALEDNSDYPETIELSTKTPFPMYQNREYLLPLKNESGEYKLVFENAPQIEITLDGGMIFHNGWNVLDDENALDVIYPQGTVDDFFYDRMKFSYKTDLSALMEKWRDIQNNAMHD